MGVGAPIRKDIRECLRFLCLSQACEDAMRSQSSRSQEGRCRQNLAMLVPWCQTPASRAAGRDSAAVEGPQSVVLCHSLTNPLFLHGWFLPACPRQSLSIELSFSYPGKASKHLSTSVNIFIPSKELKIHQIPRLYILLNPPSTHTVISRRNVDKLLPVFSHASGKEVFFFHF